MRFTSSLFLAALVAATAGFASLQPAAAASATDLTVQVRHGDRYDRYDRGRHYRGDRHRHQRYSRYRNRCYTDVDYRYRWGHRVRVVERICVRNGRRYVAERRVYRIGSRYY
jgi:hypothetical protein